MTLSELNPIKVFKNILLQLKDLQNQRTYVKIVNELNGSGKLQAIGLSLDQSSNLYIGVDLNPELLMYSDTSKESVELKMIGEKMTKYTDFLLKEGLLDSIKVDYDRVKNEEYYGYVVQISYRHNYYTKSKFIQNISYLGGLLVSTVAAVLALIAYVS